MERSNIRVTMHHSDETRRMQSEANKGQIPWIKGRKHSEESKEK